jgi:hypothetical protein
MHIIRHPAFRWFISFALILMMGYQLWEKSHHFNDFNASIFSKAGPWLFWVFLLMPVNWCIETFKWWLLLNKHNPVSYGLALGAVLRGIALSLFTPSRIGEYGGRLLFMPQAYRWPILTSTLVSSISQNLAALCAGIISCIMIFTGFVFMKAIGVIFMLMAIVIFFNLPGIVRRFASIYIHPFFNKFLRKIHWIGIYDSTSLVQSLALSMLRYAVYTSQFVLLLLAFEPSMDVAPLVLGVSALYLFHTLIPLPPVADVLARTNLALILWSGTGMSELSISLASLLVWMVNLLIPAVLGSVAIGNYRPGKSFISHDPNYRPALEPVLADPTKRP